MVREIVGSYTYAGVRYVKLTLYTLDPWTVKAIVYSTRVDSRQELIGRINGAPTELKQDKHEIRRMILPTMLTTYVT